MSKDTVLVVTSIAGDNHPILNQLAAECRKRDVRFVLMGDTKSPSSFKMEGCDFWGIDQQEKMNFSLAAILPKKHYARKNLGYLEAIKGGANAILETDDDNIPRDDFWNPLPLEVSCANYKDTGWLNVYRFFTEKMIWPRGFPLERIQNTLEGSAGSQNIYCPIQQGLADENPDVDAIYRLTYPLPINFEIKNRVALGKNAWCPFNSQNTYWHKKAFPLLYLPSYCTFRMTDIWRSYVAQRIAWECGWSILFREPTVWQERNEHDLMRDFRDEIEGYNNNLKIAAELQKLTLKPGEQYQFENLEYCYRLLVEMKVVGEEELPLLKAWTKDLSGL